MGKQPALGKTLAWAYGTVAAFAATYLLGGILLEKYSKKEERKKKTQSL